MRHRVQGLVALSLFLGACLPSPQSAPPQRFPYCCHRATGKIVIDGKLDEPAWAKAEEILDFRVPGTGAPAKAPTSVRLLWDDENLYLAAKLVDLDIYGTRKEHDSQTWDDDVCELFIKPSDIRHPYYEFQVNALGTTFDAFFGRRGAGSLDRWRPWESGMQAAVAIQGTLNDWNDKDAGWYVELAIPLKAFAATGDKAQLGARWRFAVCRYDYSVYADDGRELSSSARLSRVDYHRYEDYDYLEFGE